ncbi:MAG: hypothetical protein OEY97_00810 [Nitrospirota bacterium]|nr:hypothetical protein [Nitrospirota bacterium]
MFTTYLIIAMFAAVAVTFAVLGTRQARHTPVTPVPAHPAQLKKAA